MKVRTGGLLVNRNARAFVEHLIQYTDVTHWRTEVTSETVGLTDTLGVDPVGKWILRSGTTGIVHDPVTLKNTPEKFDAQDHTEPFVWLRYDFVDRVLATPTSPEIAVMESERVALSDGAIRGVTEVSYMCSGSRYSSIDEAMLEQFRQVIGACRADMRRVRSVVVFQDLNGRRLIRDVVNVVDGRLWYFLSTISLTVNGQIVVDSKASAPFPTVLGSHRSAVSSVTKP